MSAIVSGVIEGSIAEELDIEVGDIILSVNGEKMADLIDYRYHINSEDLTLEIQKRNGDIEEIELEKDFSEDLGIIFESAVFDRIHPCLNKCIFCFVDQQPEGLRDTLYIKDDDYRLSYLQGTYITLTNLTSKDKERISKLHIGPFYVSVHTTNPELRVKMLKNPNAGRIMDELNWLKSNDIPFHAQIVLCPGYNDGAELNRTLEDLTSIGDCLLSVAIVPVGITNYRSDNNLKRVDSNIARETLMISKKYPKVCCSDEFFLLTDEDIPPAEYYGSFNQLDDGVGAIRMLLDDFKTLNLPNKIHRPISLTFATSCAGEKALEKIAVELNNIVNLTCYVKPVKSDYWGENITVAGLITSEDLIKALAGDQSDYVIVPSIMLKPYSELFLDGKDLNYVKEKTGKRFIVIKEQYSLKELVDFLNNL